MAMIRQSGCIRRQNLKSVEGIKDEDKEGGVVKLRHRVKRSSEHMNHRYIE